MKKTLIAIAIIPMVLLIAAFGLSGIAKANTQKKHVELMETLLPGGKDFQKITYNGDDEIIRSVHKADKGYVIEAVTHGYVDEIVMYIGVDNKGTVLGVVVYDAQETPGIGSQILTNHEFLSQFLNKSGTFSIGSAEEFGADAFSSATTTTNSNEESIYVDGISGATVSSKAVARCISSAVAYVTGTDIDSSATTWGG